MAGNGSTKIVLIAMGANFTIACAKFGAYLWTGSSAMLSEAVHSVADTSNQALLLFGQRRALRPADARHPFGYAKELYFWSFIVAILLFSIGAGVSLYEGVHKLTDPHPIRDAYVNYIVLGVAFVLEAYALYAAAVEFNRRHRGEPVFGALRASKDPSLFTILLEDAAALVGLTVAFFGVLIADVAGVPEADGIASIIIGLILAYVAAFIAIEVKGLLIGESATPAVRDGIRDIILRDIDLHGGIKAINEIKTLQLGATAILVTASVDFRDGASAADVKDMSHRLEVAIRTQYRDVTKFYLEIISADDYAALQAPEVSPPTVR
ncbi:MAG: cation diffusion facilitator family transporter [Pseudomonadota bacterium]